MSIFDKQPAPTVAPTGPTTTSKPATSAWSASWSSLGFLRDTAGDDAGGPEQPWWQSLTTPSFVTPTASPAPVGAGAPSSEPSSAPSSQAPVPTTPSTSEQETFAAPTPEQTPEAARAERARAKAEAMATRSFAHSEDFDDFLFGTPPEELALVRDAYDQIVETERANNPDTQLTPFDKRFVDFTHDDARWERMAKVDQAKISESVVAIFNSCDSMGTDEDTIMKQLRGKTPDELKEMERVFQATYPGKSLAGILDDEMEGDYFAEANALLDGNPITAAAYGLENALWGVGADSAKIEEVLRDIPPDQRANVLSTYEAMFGQSFETSLAGETFMGYSEVRAFTELGAGNDAKADAHLIQYELNGGLFGWSGDKSRQHVEAILEGSSDPAAIAKAYAEVHRGKPDLDGELQKAFDAQDFGVAKALLDPAESEESKRAKVAAARIMRGLTGELDKGKVLEELTKTEGADRERLVAELEQNPAYRELVSAALLEPAEQRSDQAKFAIKFDELHARGGDEGPGVFEAALEGEVDAGSIDAAKDALAGMSKADIDARPALVSKLRAAVRGSGRDEFEVAQLLEGKPEGTPAEQLKTLHDREQKAYANERAGGSWFIDTFSDAGGYLDKRHARSEQRFETLSADGVDKADVSELERELGYTNSARSSYATRKDEVADTTANVIGAAALAAGTMATGGALAAWLPLIENAAVLANAGGAAISGLASMGTKWALKDNSYGADEAEKDLAMTMVGMGAAALSQTKGLTSLVEKGVSHPMAVAGGKGLLTGLAAGAGQGVVNSVAAGEIDYEAAVLGMAGQAVGGAVGNMVGGAIEKPLLTKWTSGVAAGSEGYLAKALPAKAIAGFGGGAVGGGAQAALDRGTYDGDTSSFLTKLGIGGLGGALGNVAQGMAEGYGDHSNGQLDWLIHPEDGNAD